MLLACSSQSATPGPMAARSLLKRQILGHIPDLKTLGRWPVSELGSSGLYRAGRGTAARPGLKLRNIFSRVPLDIPKYYLLLAGFPESSTSGHPTLTNPPSSFVTPLGFMLLEKGYFPTNLYPTPSIKLLREQRGREYPGKPSLRLEALRL